MAKIKLTLQDGSTKIVNFSDGFTDEDIEVATQSLNEGLAKPIQQPQPQPKNVVPNRPANQELTIEPKPQQQVQELNPNAQPSATQLQGGVEKKYIEQDGYYVDTETGEKTPIGGMEIRKPDDKISLKNFKDFWELGTNKKLQEQYKRQQAGEAILRGQRFAKDHPFLEGMAKDYLPGYRATQWGNEFDRTHDKNFVNDISKQIVQAGLNLIPSANLASAYATGGMSNLAKAGGIDGLVQGITSAIGDTATENADINELWKRPLSYGVVGLAGGVGANRINQGVNNFNRAANIAQKRERARNILNVDYDKLDKKGKKQFKDNVESYYRDYIQGTELDEADGLKNIKYTSSGLKELVGKSLYNGKYVPIMKGKMKNGTWTKTTWDKVPERTDGIEKFHHIENEINGKNIDFEVAEDAFGNRYYTTLDRTKPGFNQETKSRVPDHVNNSITNSVQKVNPSQEANNIINTQRENLVKDLGVDNINEIAKPEYSKEMRDEAISIISNATGKKPEYIQMIAKAQSGGKGIKTKNSKLQELLEGGSENITANGSANNYKYYGKQGLTYDDAEIEGGYNTIQQAWDDLVNDNFYLNKGENQYNNMLNGAENKVKSALKDILENPNDYENKLAQHSEDIAKYLDENVPEDARQYFYDNFYNGLDKIDNHLKEVKGLQDGSIKPSKLNQSDLGKEVNAQATYDVLHNKDLINQGTVEATKEGAYGNLLGRTLNPKEEMSALDFETGRQLATKLLSEGKTQDALNLIEGLANKASKAGQAVQALSLWSKITPEGAIAQAEKIINNYNKNATKKLPKLTEQQAQDILKLQENIMNQTDDRARDIATAQLLKYQAELIPQSGWQKVKTLRNISLLLNPKTLVRNIVGNGTFAINEVGAKALADFIDTGFSKFSGTKTRSMPKLNAMWQGLKQGTKEGIEDVSLGIDTRGGIGSRYDLPNTRSFKGGVLGKLEEALDYGLRVPDRTFYQGVYNESVANQLAAKGLKEITPEIEERARQEALEAVFQNDSKISNIVLGLRRALNKIGNKDFGLGDWLIPYAQTPANLVQQGINYSPLGFIKAALNKGDQRQASLDIARALIGSGLMGGGYALAKNGIGQGAVDDYQERKNLEAEGIRPFTINGVSFNQIQPNAVPITAGMALANPSSKGALNDALETITDLSMLDSLKQFNKDRENYGTVNAGLRQLAGLPSQFVGTGVNQINAFIDPYQRETYDPNIAKQGLNKLMAKTPGLSYALPKATDVKGEEIKKYADSPNTLAKINDVFLNPVFINKKKNNPVMQEVIRLNSDANKTLLPIAEKKLKFTLKDGTEFNKTLTSKEYVAYKNKLGKEVYNNLAELMNTEFYQNADDLQKANLINKLQKDVKDRVQQDIFNKASKKDKPKISRYERKKKQYLNKQLKNFIDDNYGEE